MNVADIVLFAAGWTKVTNVVSSPGTLWGSELLLQPRPIASDLTTYKLMTLFAQGLPSPLSIQTCQRLPGWTRCGPGSLEATVQAPGYAIPNRKQSFVIQDLLAFDAE